MSEQETKRWQAWRGAFVDAMAVRKGKREDGLPETEFSTQTAGRASELANYLNAQDATIARLEAELAEAEAEITRLIEEKERRAVEQESRSDVAWMERGMKAEAERDDLKRQLEEAHEALVRAETKNIVDPANWVRKDLHAIVTRRAEQAEAELQAAREELAALTTEIDIKNRELYATARGRDALHSALEKAWGLLNQVLHPGDLTEQEFAAWLADWIKRVEQARKEAGR